MQCQCILGGEKMKYIYRVLILSLIFFASLIFFGFHVTEKSVSVEKEATIMSESTFPILTMKVDDVFLNDLHGYASNLDEMIMRESITPLGADRSFSVIIDEKTSDVKKLKYQIFDDSGEEIEDGSMFILDPMKGEEKKVDIQLQETLVNGREYVAKITLITSHSKRIYYFTRLKVYDNAKLPEKLNFVREFHEILFDKVAAEEIKRYLEPNSSLENDSLSNVTIQSSFDLVTWGGLEPEVVFAASPTVTEFYDSMASVKLEFIVSANTDTGLEYYLVKEYYRFNYNETKSYLYNYERKMETLYDANMTSLKKAELKLGITDDANIDLFANSTNNLISFVYGRELLLFNIEKTELTKVFSYRREQVDYARDMYDNHEIRILNMDDNGNIDFLVFGYMNRGEYEGRVGIVLYQYIAEEKRIEEQAYLPFNCSYQILKEELSEFTYRNQYDVFYFSVFDRMYSYNLVTKQLVTLSEDAPKDKIIFQKAGHYIAWQNSSEDEEADRIFILDLESGARTELAAPTGEKIQLLGMIDKNLIYGYARKIDAEVFADGTKRYPVYKLMVCDISGAVVKEYEKEGVYISGLTAEENVITLTRMKKAGSAYTPIEDDYILNQSKGDSFPFHVTKRITDLTLTEYYITLPENTNISSIPSLLFTSNTVILEDTTVRVIDSYEKEEQYYAYSFGEIIFTSDLAGEVIVKADNQVGTVINQDGKLVWERGVKTLKAEIVDIAPIYAEQGLTSVQASLKMLMAYKNMEVDVDSYSSAEIELTDWMRQYLKASPVNLTGASLDEVLYFIYQKRPVIALKQSGAAVLITAYDAMGITVIDPLARQTTKYAMKDAVALFEAEGNRFISYIE